jgi:hypothetical protein
VYPFLTLCRHRHGAIDRTLVHLLQVYSPDCLEEKFSEVHIQDPA